MTNEPRLSRVVLGGIVDGLLAAGYPCRTRYCRYAIAYVAPVGGYSLVNCREYSAGADTWRVHVRHYWGDFGGGKWLLPTGVEKPHVATDGHGNPIHGEGGYCLEFSFARSDSPSVAPWIVSYIVAKERGVDPEPYPDLSDRWKWPPSEMSGYLWTRAGNEAQEAYQKLMESRGAARDRSNRRSQ